MTITQTLNPVDSGGLTVMKEMKIKANSLSFKILAEKLYQDPLSAVFREMGQNCADAHLKVGNPEPFTIEFPTISNPYLSFIDNGTGMDPAFIEDNENGYLSAFDSTKRTENSSSGGFGIGRISFFSLCDQYSLINRWNGVISTYQLFFNEKGIPTLAKISEAPTNLRNGVTITGAVPLKLINDCHYKARAIFQWYDILPNFLYYNGPKIHRYNLSTEYKKENNWYITNTHDSYVWMGTYAYEFDAEAFGDRLTEQQRLLLKCGVVIKANVGDVSVNVSREAINYDEQAYSYLIGRLNDIIIDLEPILKAELCTGRTKYHRLGKYKKYDFNFKQLIKTYKSILTPASLAAMDDEEISVCIEVTEVKDTSYYDAELNYYSSFNKNSIDSNKTIDLTSSLKDDLIEFGIPIDDIKRKVINLNTNSVIIINDNKSEPYVKRGQKDTMLGDAFRLVDKRTDKSQSVYFVSQALAAAIKVQLAKHDIEDLFEFINASSFFTPPPKVAKIKDVKGFVSVLTFGHAQVEDERRNYHNSIIKYFKPKRCELDYGHKYYYLDPAKLDKFVNKGPFLTGGENLLITRCLLIPKMNGLIDGSPIIWMSGNSENAKYVKNNKEFGTDLLPILKKAATDKKMIEGIKFVKSLNDVYSNLYVLIERGYKHGISFKMPPAIRAFYDYYSKNKQLIEEWKVLGKIIKLPDTNSKLILKVEDYISKKNPLLYLLKSSSVGELSCIVDRHQQILQNL